MKKMWLMLLAVFICLCLSACGKSLDMEKLISSPVKEVIIRAGGEETRITEQKIVEEVVKAVKNSVFRPASASAYDAPGAQTLSVEIITETGTVNVTYPCFRYENRFYDAGADSIKPFYAIMNAAAAAEIPTWERQSEYRYPGATEADAVVAMEDFLRSHYGKEAENFKRMTFRKDWRYQYNGVNTDYVYSFRIEQGEVVICDNTGGADLSRIKARIDEFLDKYHPDAKSDAIWMQKRAAYLSTEVGSIEYNYTVGSVLYCAEDDQFYEFMQYDVVNDEGWHAARDVVFDPIEW